MELIISKQNSSRWRWWSEKRLALQFPEETWLDCSIRQHWEAFRVAALRWWSPLEGSGLTFPRWPTAASKSRRWIGYWANCWIGKIPRTRRGSQQRFFGTEGGFKALKECQEHMCPFLGLSSDWCSSLTSRRRWLFTWQGTSLLVRKICGWEESTQAFYSLIKVPSLGCWLVGDLTGN